MTTIYFTNRRKRQLANILKKYPCTIYEKNFLKFEFKKLNKIKSISTLTLNFSNIF